MRKRSIARLVVSIGISFTAVACGGADDPTSSGPDEAFVFPDDPDVLVLSLDDQNGYADVARIRITADGRVFTPTDRRVLGFAPPRPLPPTGWEIRQVSSAGLEAIFVRADDLGLFDDDIDVDDYSVTDQGSTRLTLRTGSRTVELDAYALGFDDERGERADLQAFGRELLDPESMVGAGELGEPELFVPEQWFVEPRGFSGSSPQGPWPLAEPPQTGCTELDPAEFPGGLPGTFDEAVEVSPVFPWTVC